MFGIDLNQPIQYKHASLRIFKEGEYHISRTCADDVLLLVYKGILRFHEDGQLFELQPGQYHIQHHGSVQQGLLPSSTPEYLYVHFSGEWTDGSDTLPRSGRFDYSAMQQVIEQMNDLAHSSAPHLHQTAKFYELLTRLTVQKEPDTLASQIANYIQQNCLGQIHLDTLCKEFRFSQNHIIRIFRDAYGMTPVKYANRLRMQRAQYYIEATSDPLDQIALQCGFQDYTHFYKLFYRENGCSPSQWRKQKRIG